MVHAAAIHLGKAKVVGDDEVGTENTCGTLDREYGATNEENKKQQQDGTPFVLDICPVQMGTVTESIKKWWCGWL